MSVAFRPEGLHLLYSQGFDWFGDRHYSEPEETRLNSRLLEAGWHVPLLRHRSAELVKHAYEGSEGQRSETQLLLRQAQVIEARLQQWKAQLPLEWMPLSLPYVSTQEDLVDAAYASAWPGPITTYESLLIATVFNNFHILRLLTTTACLRISEWLTISPSFSSFDFALDPVGWQTRQQEIVDEICSATPYQTGEYPSDFLTLQASQAPHPEPKMRDYLGSYMVYYPLAVAIREVRMEPQQAAWLTEQLDRIEQVNGCGLSCNLFFGADNPGSFSLDEGSPGPAAAAAAADRREQSSSRQPSTRFKHSDMSVFEDAAMYSQ